jgi:hypothetical protein
MKGISMGGAVLWAPAAGELVLAGALAAVLATDSRSQAPNQPIINNGGAREWVAVDRFAGGQPGLNTFKVITLVNTSTARNSFVVNYELDSGTPRRRVCGGTLAAGQSTVCGVSARPDRGFTNGYFQVRASQPLIPAGVRDVAMQGWEERTQRVRGRVRGTGQYQFAGPAVIQQIPYEWQPGCPPRAGSGCPGDPRGPGIAQG